MPVGLDSFRSPSPALDALRRSDALRRRRGEGRQTACQQSQREGRQQRESSSPPRDRGDCDCVSDDLVDRVVGLDVERRAALHGLGAARAEQRALKRMLHQRHSKSKAAAESGDGVAAGGSATDGGASSGPRDDDDDDEDEDGGDPPPGRGGNGGAETAHSVTEQLEALGERILHLQNSVLPAVEAELERLLPHVGSALDETPFHDDGGDEDANGGALAAAERPGSPPAGFFFRRHHVLDPLWCLGGYDVISPPVTTGRGGQVGVNRTAAFTPPSSSSSRRVLRGVGCGLADAIRSHALSFIGRRSDDGSSSPGGDGDGDGGGGFMGIGIGKKGGDGGNCYETVMVSGTMRMDPASLASTSGCDCRRSTSNEDDERFHKPGVVDVDATGGHHHHPGDGCCCALGLRFDEVREEGVGGVLSQHQRHHSSVPMPPYVQMSLLHKDKSYSEKTLPKRFICRCPCPPPHSPDRHAAGSSTSSQTAAALLPREHVPCAGERIEIFVLCECELSTSRSIQDETARRIASFHASLLVRHRSGGAGAKEEESTDGGTGTNGAGAAAAEEGSEKLRGGRGTTAGMVRIRVASPAELLPREARRLIVEGWSPPRAHDGDDGHHGGHYVELGHVSNLTDYVSRPCGTKFASSSGLGAAGVGGGSVSGGSRKEYVHTVHGVFCDVGVALPWMVGCNTVVAPRSWLDGGRGGGGRDGAGPGLGEDEAPERVLVQRKETKEEGGHRTDTDAIVAGCMVPPCLVRCVAGEESPLRRRTADGATDTGSDRYPGQANDGASRFVFLPFVRRRVRGRGGKLVTREVKIATDANDGRRGRIIYLPPRSSLSVFENSDDRVNDDDVSGGRPRRNNVGGREQMADSPGMDHDHNRRHHPKGGVLSLRPNPRQVVAESLCDPFYFLPFSTDRRL